MSAIQLPGKRDGLTPSAAAEPSSETRLSLPIALLVLLIVLAAAAVGLGHSGGNAPMPREAPADHFSAVRAMAHVRAIATRPHPLGSPADAEARDYVRARLLELGLQPHEQVALGIGPSRRGLTAGTVHNLVVRMPGALPGPAVMLLAHIDSVPTGPGAADDAASVAAILETLRALRASAAPQHDVIALFTDGEEAGLLGAQAFVAEHPWAHSIAVALNFEFRGSSGPMLMFETSSGNARLVQAFAAAPHPIGNSLLVELYRRMPNDTDLSPFKRVGIAGLNFASIESSWTYHAETDTADRLSADSLQHEGDLMLSLARHLSDQPAEALQASADEVYFDLPGGLVHYPVSWVIFITAGVAAAIIGLATRAVKTGCVRVGRVAIAVAAFAVPILGLPLAVQLLWKVWVIWHPQTLQLIGGLSYDGEWLLAGMVSLVVAGFVVLQRIGARWLRADERLLGAEAWWLAGLLATSAWFPGASFLFAWPLVVEVLYGLWRAVTGVRADAAGAVVARAVAAVPVVILVAPVVRLLFVGLGPQAAALAALLLVLLLGVLVPTLDALDGALRLPAKLAGVGLLLVLLGPVVQPFDAERPAPTDLSYAFDGNGGHAWWLSSNVVRDTWTRPYVGAQAQPASAPPFLGAVPGLWWSAPAPDFHVTAPVIEMRGDITEDAMRLLKLHLRSARHAGRMELAVDGVPVLHARVEGHDGTAGSRDGWVLSAFAVPDAGLDVYLRVPPGRPLTLRLTDATDGLAELGVPSRPDGLMNAVFGPGGTVRATTRLDVR